MSMFAVSLTTGLFNLQDEHVAKYILDRKKRAFPTRQVLLTINFLWKQEVHRWSHAPTKKNQSIHKEFRTRFWSLELERSYSSVLPSKSYQWFPPLQGPFRWGVIASTSSLSSREFSTGTRKALGHLFSIKPGSRPRAKEKTKWQPQD